MRETETIGRQKNQNGLLQPGRTQMKDKKMCINCGNHGQVPFLLQDDDPECPYVRCSIDGKVKPKWSGDDCEDWREEDG